MAERTNHLRGVGVGVGVAAGLAIAAALPAVWWEPLHVDEAVTLEYAPRGAGAILQDVFVERGGAPAFFLVENLTLRWPGGIEGLRLPALAFFLAALASSALFLRDLAGRGEALLVAPLLAVAPLAVGLATFARMYTLFLAATFFAGWLLLRAVRVGSTRTWIAAGAAAGALVYVHPIAPLYVGIAFVTAWLASGLPLRRFLSVARAGLVAAAAVVVPYLYALAVLRSRYGVGTIESSLLEAGTGRSVPAEAALALTPGRWAGVAVFAGAACAGCALLLRRNRRIGAAVVLWILLPLGFFSLVPAETTFFPRYLLPSLPLLLLLVVVPVLEAQRRLGARAPVAILAVAALLAWEAHDAVTRLDHLRDLRLRAATEEIDGLGSGAVLFSSTGAALAGRPADLLDTYHQLAGRPLAHVEELPAIEPAYEPDITTLGVREVRAFLDRPAAEAVGVWLLIGHQRRVSAAIERLRTLDSVATVRISPRLLVVHTELPHDGHGLVELSILVRSAWLGRGNDRWARTLIEIDREAIGNR